MKLANGMEVKLRSGVYAETVLERFNYLAADSDGEVFAFEEMPYLPHNITEDCEVFVWDLLDGDLDYIGDVVMPKHDREATLATLTEI